MLTSFSKKGSVIALAARKKRARGDKKKPWNDYEIWYCIAGEPPFHGAKWLEMMDGKPIKIGGTPLYKFVVGERIKKGDVSYDSIIMYNVTSSHPKDDEEVRYISVEKHNEVLFYLLF